MPSLDLGDLEEVDYDPFKRRGLLDQFGTVPEAQPQPDLTEAARQGKLGTLSAGNPSWGDQLAGGFSNAVGLLGATPEGQRNAYEFGQNLTNVIPGVSNAVSANDAYRDFQSGNYLSGILNTAGAVPVPGLKPGLTAAQTAAKEAAHDFPTLLKALGPKYENAPVVNKAGEIVHGAADWEQVGGPLAFLNDQGELDKGILTYHGSPHSFNKMRWDPEVAGTGEGSQAFSYGAYTAEEPKVSKTYLNPEGKLGDVVTKDGEIIKPNQDEVTLGAHGYLTSADGDYDAARGLLTNENKFENDPYYQGYNQLVLNKLNDWEDAGHKVVPPDSAMYQVGIKHDPDTFLDFDAPMRKQHPDVQRALNGIYGRKFPSGMTGDEAHSWLIKKFQQENPGASIDEANAGVTDQLKAKGVPGVRFLDEYSRGGDYDFSKPIGKDAAKILTKIHPDIGENTTIGDAHQYLFDVVAKGQDAAPPRGTLRKITNILASAGVKPEQPATTTRNYATFSADNMRILKKLATVGGVAGSLELAGPGSALASEFWKRHPDLYMYQIQHDNENEQ